jgi:hypothetical protein
VKAVSSGTMYVLFVRTVMLLTKAVSSCGLEMSEGGLVDFVPFDGVRVEPLGDEGLGDGLEGVADGVTFKGSAADEAGILNSVYRDQ